MIDRHHHLSIARQAKLPDFSRGSVSYLPRRVPEGILALIGGLRNCIWTTHSREDACYRGS